MTSSGAVTMLSTMAFGAIMVAQDRLDAPGTTMDPTLFAAAVVTVIAALGGVTVQIINSVSAARDRREAAAERKSLMEKTSAVADKADTIVTGVAEVHTATNSLNSNLQKALELMTEKFAGAQRELSQARETKKETAAVQAVTDLKTALASPPPGPAAAISGQPKVVTQVLESIDDNTAAIEKNTARVQSSVDEVQSDVQALKKETP